MPGRSSYEEGILRRSPTPRVLITLAVIGMLFVTVAGFLLTDVPLDTGLSLWFNGFHVGAIGALTTGVYHVFSPGPAIAITLAVAGVVWFGTKDVRPALAFAGLVAVTWVPSALIKLIVHRPRPDVTLQPHPFAPVQVDPSYPSGHTVFIATIVIALVFVLQDTRWLGPTVLLGTALIVVVGLSLVIDGVHYPTDVVASIVWAITVAPAVRVVGVDLILPRLGFLDRRGVNRNGARRAIRS